MKFSAIICLMQKNVSELMKSSIERKYGSNGSSFGNGKNGSNGKTDIDKAVEY